MYRYTVIRLDVIMNKHYRIRSLSVNTIETIWNYLHMQMNITEQFGFEFHYTFQ